MSNLEVINFWTRLAHENMGLCQFEPIYIICSKFVTNRGTANKLISPESVLVAPCVGMQILAEKPMTKNLTLTHKFSIFNHFSIFKIQRF